MRVRIGLVCLALLVLGLYGCGNDSTSGPTNDDFFEATLNLNGIPGTGVTALSFALTGEQVVPPQSTSASGSVDLILGKSNLNYSITLKNALSITRAELYVGAPGDDGTLVAVLFTSAPVPFVDTTLVDSAITSFDVLTISFETLMSAIADGMAYVQIASASAPQGLLRGQTAPSGQATLTLGSGAVAFEVKTMLLDGITKATLNDGIPGRTGDVQVVLFDDATGRDDINGRLVSGVFHGSDILDSVSIDSLLTLIRAEHTYINVTTLDNPTGAIRGQVELVE